MCRFSHRLCSAQLDIFYDAQGASQLVPSPQGLTTRHRDDWDAAEELYEKLPPVGSLLRWLKKRANP